MKKKPTHGTGDQSRQNLPDDPEQSKRFEETARELDAGKNREQFEKALGTIMPTKIADDRKKKSDAPWTTKTKS